MRRVMQFLIVNVLILVMAIPLAGARTSGAAAPRTIFVFLQGFATRLSGCPTTIEHSPFAGFKSYLAAQGARAGVLLREGYELLDFSYVPMGSGEMPGAFRSSGLWCPAPFSRLQSGGSLASADQLLVAMLRAVVAHYAQAQIPVRFVLIGHSKGGDVAADVASQDGDLPIAEVVTIDSPLLGINTEADLLTETLANTGPFSAQALASVVLAGTRIGSFLGNVLGLGTAFLAEMSARWQIYEREGAAYAMRTRAAIQAHGAHLLTITNTADIAVPAASALLPGGPAFAAQVIAPADLPLLLPYTQPTLFAPSSVFPALVATQLLKLVSGGAGIMDSVRAVGATTNSLHGALLNPAADATSYSSGEPHWHITAESPDPSYPAILTVVQPLL